MFSNENKKNRSLRNIKIDYFIYGIAVGMVILFFTLCITSGVMAKEETIKPINFEVATSLRNEIASSKTETETETETTTTSIKTTEETILEYYFLYPELSPQVEYFTKQEGTVHTSMSFYGFAEFFDELKAAAPDTFSGLFFREKYEHYNFSTCPISFQTDVVIAERNGVSAEFNGDFDVTIHTDKLREAIEEWRDTRTAICSIVTAVVESGSTKTEAVQKINDYLCEQLEYDTHYLAQKPLKQVLETKTCVCNGYARLFYEMARTCGIETRCIIGKTSINSDTFHMWNSVFIDGKWQSIDVTANDNKINPNCKALGTDFSGYFEYAFNPYDFQFIY